MASQTSILWLFGPAGTGKSTLARLLANQLENDKLLAGSFFFCRTDASRNSYKFLVPTLAYQICHSITETQPYFEEVVINDPTIISRCFPSQFDSLIVKAIKSVFSCPPSNIQPMLILIDALDECENERERSIILETIFNAFPQLCGNLKFVILSRPERTIKNFFNSSGMKGKFDKVDLSEMQVAEMLLQTFLRHNITHSSSTLNDIVDLYLHNLDIPEDPDPALLRETCNHRPHSYFTLPKPVISQAVPFREKDVKYNRPFDEMYYTQCLGRHPIEVNPPFPTRPVNKPAIDGGHFSNV